MGALLGMCGALVGFFWTLVAIVQSFNPDTGPCDGGHCALYHALNRCQHNRAIACLVLEYCVVVVSRELIDGALASVRPRVGGVCTCALEWAK